MTKNDLLKTLNAYETYLLQAELRPNTVLKYVKDVQKLLTFGQEAEMDKASLLAYKKHLLEQYKPASANSYLASANRFLRWAGLDTLTVKIRPLPHRTSLENVITEEEYRRLLDFAIRDGKIKAALLIRTFACLGIRAGELRFITAEAAREGRALLDNKGRYRQILLPDSLREALLGYCEKRGIQSGVIFHGRQPGQPLDHSSIWRTMKTLACAAGVDPAKVYPHNFRHLFAKTYMKKIGNIAELADLLGHASIETTRIYTLTGEEEKRESLNLLGL